MTNLRVGGNIALKVLRIRVYVAVVLFIFAVVLAASSKALPKLQLVPDASIHPVDVRHHSLVMLTIRDDDQIIASVFQKWRYWKAAHAVLCVQHIDNTV